MRQDPYLDRGNSYFRLLREYEEHGSLIIAVDFDNTIYDFHSNGDIYPKVTELAKECDGIGFDVMIFTANEDHALIGDYCESVGLNIVGINMNVLPQFTGDKIYYNILLDDRSGLGEAFQTLTDVINTIKGKKI